jgi:hypothetical protein
MSSFPPICGLSLSSIGGIEKKKRKLNLNVRNNSQGHILSTIFKGGSYCEGSFDTVRDNSKRLWFTAY